MSKLFKRGISDARTINKAKKFFETTMAGKAICEGIEKRDLFVCIRENYFNVYRNGCALLKFQPNASKQFLVHEKYWPVKDFSGIKKSGGSLSLNLDIDDSESTRLYIKTIIQEPNSNLNEYLKSKSGESEKELLQAYLKNLNSGDKKTCLIDLETAFSCKSSKNDPQRPFVAKRVDLAVLEQKELKVVLRFIEAKVVSDSRLRAEKTDPEVVQQMKQYEEFLDSEADEIIKSYQRVAKNYVDNFPYLMPRELDRSLMKDFYSTGEIDKNPSLLLMAKEGDIKERLQGKNGKNNGNHYKTLDDLCRENKWELRPWVLL